MGYRFSCQLTATLNLCLIYFKVTWVAIQLAHMHKKFEISRTKIKSSCQSGRKVVTYDSKSDLPLLFDEKFWTDENGKETHLIKEPLSVGSEHLRQIQSKYHSSFIFFLLLKFPYKADRYCTDISMPIGINALALTYIILVVGSKVYLALQMQ